MDQGVNVLRDARWKDVRNTLSPAFSGNKMKQMNPLINESCDQLVEHFNASRTKGSIIQCKDLFGAYSMDVIASTFFGIQVDSQKNPNDPFVKHAKDAFNFNIFSIKILLVFLFPKVGKIFDMLNIGLTDSRIKTFFLDVITRIITARKNGVSQRMDILQLMMTAHKMDSKGEKLAEKADNESSSHKKPLSNTEIMANSFIFFIAGYETTNTALCFISYLLATNPEAQEKLINEVDDFTPNREAVVYEILSKMEYLDGVVKESLRIFPPVAATDRHNGGGTVVSKGLEIPNGCGIFIPIYAIHHDPDIWSEPEEFRPERFSKENSHSIHPLSWLPFGEGPRNCIGMRLAIMEVKFALIRLLQEFRFETCSETEIPPILGSKSAFISPPNGIKLQVVPRKKTE